MNKKPNKIDRACGSWLERIRRYKGVNREVMAEAMGISHQQLQKYEKGHNRITVGRLDDAAKFLGCNLLDLIPPNLDDDGRVFMESIDPRVVQLYNALNKKKRLIVRDIMRKLA